LLLHVYIERHDFCGAKSGQLLGQGKVDRVRRAAATVRYPDLLGTIDEGRFPPGGGLTAFKIISRL
jgi:hypothetical protein